MLFKYLLSTVKWITADDTGVSALRNLVYPLVDGFFSDFDAFNVIFLSDTPMKIMPLFVLAKATADSIVRSSNFSLNSTVSDSPVLMRSGRFIYGLTNSCVMIVLLENGINFYKK